VPYRILIAIFGIILEDCYQPMHQRAETIDDRSNRS